MSTYLTYLYQHYLIHINCVGCGVIVLERTHTPYETLLVSCITLGSLDITFLDRQAIVPLALAILFSYDYSLQNIYYRDVHSKFKIGN